MSTTLYLRRSPQYSVADFNWNNGVTYLFADGTTYFAAVAEGLMTTRGTGAWNISTVLPSGPTAPVDWGGTAGYGTVFVSPPLAADVTISGAVSFNLWAWETAMSSNAGPNARVLRIRGDTGEVTEVCRSANTTELPTSNAANSWSIASGYSGVAFNKGDRIMIACFWDDAGGDMGGGSARPYFSAASAGIAGDSYATFTETFSFMSSPSGTTLYPTTADSDAGVGKTAWTSRGGSATTSVTNTVAGPTNPIQITATAGGATLEWYSQRLLANTLAGAVLVNARILGDGGKRARYLCEIAVCDGDGSNVSVWGLGGSSVMSDTTERAYQFWVAGDDKAISDGQRIRIRFYIDDSFYANNNSTWQGSMQSGGTQTLYYNGPTGGASGDTYVQLPMAVEEYTGGAVTKSGNFTVNASIYYPGRPGSFSVNALIRTPNSGWKNLDAVLRKTQIPAGGFKLDAAKWKGTITGFSVAASITKTVVVGKGQNHYYATPNTAKAGSHPGYEWRILSPSNSGSSPVYAEAREGQRITYLDMPAQPYSLYNIWGQYYDHTFPGLYSYGCWEGLIYFDTSDLAPGATVNEAYYEHCDPAAGNSPAGTYELRAYNWGGGRPNTYDFIPGSLLGNLYLGAHLAEADQATGGGGTYYRFTDDGMVNTIAWPWTSYLLSTSHHRLGNTPTGNENAETWAGGYGGSPPNYEGSNPEPPHLYVDWTSGSPKDLYAWIIKQPSSSFGLNAVIRQPNRPGTPFTLDAWKGGSVEASFTANAVRHKLQGGSFPLDAVKARVGAGSFLAEAFVQPYFQLNAVVASNAEEKLGNFDADAVIFRPAMAGVPFTLDALKLQANQGSATLNALRLAPIPGGKTADAVIQGSGGGGALLDALSLREMPQGFAAAAWKAATIQGGATLDANIYGVVTRGMTVNADIKRFDYQRSFAVNAVLVPLRSAIDAIISQEGHDLFWVNAVIVPVEGPTESTVAGGFGLAAVIGTARVSQFGAHAWIALVTGTQLGARSLDADIRRVGAASGFRLNAYVIRPESEQGGIAYLEAWIAGPYPGSATLDAVVVGRTREAGFVVAADIMKVGEVRGSFTLDALLHQRTADQFWVNAEILRDAFLLSAWVAHYATLNAFITGIVPAGFSLNAYLSKATTIDAVIRRVWTPTFSLNAVVASASGAFPDRRGSVALDAIKTQGAASQFWLEAAVIADTPPASFSLDAFVGRGFGLSAWIAAAGGGLGGFGVDAYLRGLDIVIYPPGGGPPTDGAGNPLPPGYAAGRSYRVKITVGGTEVTGDVIWAEAEFNQQARTGPGTFSVSLLGAYDFHGGEEILLTVGDLREFGGYVLSVTYGYVFDAVDQPKTILRGADYNILLDRLVVYNKDQPARYGPYTSWKPFAQETLDSTIIHKVFSTYVDLPPGFDYETFVDTIDTAAPETPWSMPQAGSPIRQVMQSISQVTNGIFWIDAYMALHYHARSTITAPAPITDSEGGITGQRISLQTDINKMVTDTRLWGTLARRVQGDLMMTHHYNHADEYGLWQYGEWRSEIHHPKWLNRRAGSIINRYSLPIERARVTIFDPGYAAGQVVPVILNEYGVNASLPIRELRLTFAVSKGPLGNVYYAVPRYELTIGIDPEDPWNIYDFLPFEDWNVGQNDKAVGQRKFWGVGPVDPYKIIWDTFDNRVSQHAPWPRTAWGLGLPDMPADIYQWGLTSSWDYYNWEWWFGSYWYTFLPGWTDAWVENGSAVMSTNHQAWSAFSDITWADQFLTPSAMHVGPPPLDGGWRGDDTIGHQDFEVEILYSFDNTKPDERENNWGQAMILQVIPNGLINPNGGIEGAANAYAIFPNQGAPGLGGEMGTPGGKWHAKWASGARPGKNPGVGDFGSEFWYSKVKLWKDGTSEPLEWFDLEADGVDWNSTQRHPGFPDTWWRPDSWKYDASVESVWPHAYGVNYAMGNNPNYAFRILLYAQQPEANMAAGEFAYELPIDVNAWPRSILRIDWIKFKGQSFYTLGGYVTDGWGAEVVDVVDGHFVTSAAPGRGTLSVYDTDTGKLLDPATDWGPDPAQPDGLHYQLLRGLNPPYVTCAYRVSAQGLRTTHMTTRVNVQNVEQDRLRLLDIKGQ